MRRLLLALLLLPACDGPSGASPDAKAPPAVEDARILRAQLEIRQLAAELAQHHALRGEWPEDWRALKRSGRDPWGNEYAFETDGEVATVLSAGPDGEFETDDDLSGQ
jgi:hypothetical protein